MIKGLHSASVLCGCTTLRMSITGICFRLLPPYPKTLLSVRESFAEAVREEDRCKSPFFSVTQKDAEVYQRMGSRTVFFPVFLPEWKVNTGKGKGSFCLYHGDLSVAENEKAAIWLLQAVFNDLSLPFVVAGKNPSEKLSDLIESNQGTCLIANPDENEMQDLISKAHINIIPSYNTTGIKLKLLNALFNGRHCLVNQETIEGTGLENACFIAATADEFKTAITEIYVRPFCENEMALRHQILDHLFDNEKNAQAMIECIFS